MATQSRSGIGLAFALKFLELGNEVIVTGRRQAVLDQAKAKHPKLHTIQSDVAEPAQIAALAARVKAEFPRLDVLMNNAGIMLHKNLTAPAAAYLRRRLAGELRVVVHHVDLLALPAS